MFQIGVLLHQAKSGRLIIRLSKEVRPGALIFDEGGRKVGKIAELIGPVRAPYASVMVMGGRTGKQGDPVYLERSPS